MDIDLKHDKKIVHEEKLDPHSSEPQQKMKSPGICFW
jgi:hypothetical protein